jgi:hypothetical protein
MPSSKKNKEASDARKKAEIKAELEKKESIPISPHLSLTKSSYKIKRGFDPTDVQEGMLVADTAEDEITSIRQNIDKSIETLRSESSDDNLVASIEESTQKLVNVSETLIENFRKVPSSLEPRMYVLRPEIKLIDAGLAHKDVDSQNDVNTHLAFATLFLGTGIASITSLLLALTSDSDENAVAVAIHSSVISLSLIVTIIFGILSIRSYKKANLLKEQIEDDVQFNELGVEFIDENENEEAIGS